MGDRGVIKFKQGKTIEAAIYTHWYGSDADEVLVEFFKANEAAGNDTRYDDPSYLAARFIAHVMKGEPYGLGWGIVPADGSVDAQTFWTVDCGDLVGPERRPRVSRAV